MIPLSTEPSATTFLHFVYDWFRLLAHSEFTQAASALDEPTSYGERWSAGSIQNALHDYAFDCSVPLAGEWSDLTAQFEFLLRPSGFAVVLQDLHVL